MRTQATSPGQIVRRRARRRSSSAHSAYRWVRALSAVFAALLAALALTAVAGAGALVGVYIYFAQDLPAPEAITSVHEHFQTTRLLDHTGTVVLQDVIDPFGGDRQWVTLAEIPDHLEWATISIEDASFYQNPGFDLRGMMRALWNNLTGGNVQGASTITQQLVRQVLFDPATATAVTMDRKIREIILASEISRIYSKPQILEWYLNTNFYGNLAYGVEAASQVYFGKSVRDLTMAESSVLAAIPQSPAMNPIDNPEQAKLRQLLVLDAMVREGYISQREANAVYAEPFEVRPITQRYNILAPHYTILARQEAERILNALGYDGARLVSRGGLRIYTALDLDLQNQAECVARSHIARLSGADPATVINATGADTCPAADYLPPLPEVHEGWDHQVSSAAIVVTNPQTGEVVAMVGSLDYHDASIDGAFNAALGLRQPGSAFKPFTYVTAFAQGYTPATMVLDVRTAFPQGGTLPDYVPENYDRKFHGPMSIRSALANSYNVPAVQVTRWVGVDEVIRTAHRMGINSLNQDLNYYGLSLTLGGGAASLMDMTYAYSVFANMGEMRGMPVPDSNRRPGYRILDPVFIKRIEMDDPQGGPPIVLWQYGEAEGTFAKHTVLASSLAYLINDILADTQARWPAMGRGNALELSRPAAVKTGTTDDYRDSWTIGYTPQLVVGVWVGNSDSSPMVAMPGTTGAAPIWHALMEYALRDQPVKTWERPANVRELTVCEISGLLPTAYCPTRKEVFIAGTEPTQLDDMFRPFRVNKTNGRAATVYTPSTLVEERVYPIFPPEAADWVRENNIAQPPTEYDFTNIPRTTDYYGDVTIIEPGPFSYVRGVVDIIGNARDRSFSSYRLSYGQGINPTEWFQIGQNQFRQRENDELGKWDTTTLDGLYSLRLTVIRTNSSVVDFVVPITVDNQSPNITLTYPEDGQVYRYPSDEYVSLQTRTSDNVSMDRVEFFMDGELFATTAVSPFNARWTMAGPGEHTFWAVAYDAAGNARESNRVSVSIVEGQLAEAR